MKKFKIIYTFDGEGTTVIRANSKKDAENIFFNGDYGVEEEIEEGKNYEITEISEKK
jgi:hypothetical protein